MNFNSSWVCYLLPLYQAGKADDTTPILVQLILIDPEIWKMISMALSSGQIYNKSPSWNLLLRSIPLLRVRCQIRWLFFTVVEGHDQILQWEKNLSTHALNISRSQKILSLFLSQGIMIHLKKGSSLRNKVMFHSILCQMTKWCSIKIRLEDILVVKWETFTDGCLGIAIIIDMGNRAHPFVLSEFQFYSEGMTRKFLSSSKSLACSGHCKIEMLISLTATRALKRKAPFQSPSTFEPKTYQQVSQILTNLCETMWNPESGPRNVKEKVDQTTIRDHSSDHFMILTDLFVSEASGHLLANEFH